MSELTEFNPTAEIMSLFGKVKKTDKERFAIYGINPNRGPHIMICLDCYGDVCFVLLCAHDGELICEYVSCADVANNPDDFMLGLPMCCIHLAKEVIARLPHISTWLQSYGVTGLIDVQNDCAHRQQPVFITDCGFVEQNWTYAPALVVMGLPV